MAAADYRLMTEATGQRIAIALENLAGFGDYLTTSDVVNNLTSTATDKPGSANMLRVLATKITFITLNNITLNDHSTTTFDLSSYIPDGYNLWSVNVTMRGTDGRFYQLPWISSNGSATSVEAAPLNSNYPKTISIKDSVGGWGTTSMYITAFLQPA